MEAWLVTDFMAAYRKCLLEGGVMWKENYEETVGSDILMTDGKRIIAIEGDFQISELFANYAATGSGFAHAEGSLYSSVGKTPKQRARLALSAASEYVMSVGPPYKFLEVKG